MQPTTLPVPQRPTSFGTAAQQILPVEYARLLLKEGRRRIVMLALIFATIAALTFVVGMFVVARHYEVSVTILAQDSDIIRPLLEGRAVPTRSEEHTSELQSLKSNSYAVCCFKKQKPHRNQNKQQ